MDLLSAIVDGITIPTIEFAPQPLLSINGLRPATLSEKAQKDTNKQEAVEEAPTLTGSEVGHRKNDSAPELGFTCMGDTLLSSQAEVVSDNKGGVDIEPVDHTSANRTSPRSPRALETKIKELWSLSELGGQQLARDSEQLTREREEHKAVRRELEESLYFYKKRYCGKGREGVWKPFVDRIGMTLTTADRYAKRYEARMALPNLVSDELSPEQDINKLAKDMANRLAPRLKEYPVALTFMDRLRECLAARLKTYAEAEIAS